MSAIIDIEPGSFIREPSFNFICIQSTALAFDSSVFPERIDRLNNIAGLRELIIRPGLEDASVRILFLMPRNW